jgi:hypothetical protein
MSKLVIGLLCLAVGALAAVVVGMSMEEEKADAGVPTTRWLNIPAVSFVARSGSSHNDFEDTIPEACPSFVSQLGTHGDMAERFGRVLSNGGSFIAPVALPHGATAATLSLFAKDKHDIDGSDIVAYLIRKRTQDGTGIDSGYSVLANASTGFTPGNNMKAFSDTTVSNGVIDNSRYTYWVEVVSCVASIALNAVSVRITYTTP